TVGRLAGLGRRAGRSPPEPRRHAGRRARGRHPGEELPAVHAPPPPGRDLCAFGCAWCTGSRTDLVLERAVRAARRPPAAATAAAPSGSAAPVAGSRSPARPAAAASGSGTTTSAAGAAVVVVVGSAGGGGTGAAGRSGRGPSGAAATRRLLPAAVRHEGPGWDVACGSVRSEMWCQSYWAASGVTSKTPYPWRS